MKDCSTCIHQTLDLIKIGEYFRIHKITGNNRISNRLLIIGFMPCIIGKVISIGPFGDPMQVKITNGCYAIRRSEAIFIEVEKIPPI